MAPTVKRGVVALAGLVVVCLAVALAVPGLFRPGPSGGSTIPARVMGTSDYYLTTEPLVRLWQRGSDAYALVSVGTVYGSGDDSRAADFKPHLVAVALDGRPLHLLVALPGQNDPRSAGADGAYSAISGWNARGEWAGRGDSGTARMLTARVCWPSGSCASVTFTRCSPALMAALSTNPAGPQLDGPRWGDGVVPPRDAQVFYARTDDLGDASGNTYRQCGAVSIRR